MVVWIIWLIFGFGFYCIKFIGIKFVVDVVDIVLVVVECISYIVWCCNRKCL